MPRQLEKSWHYEQEPQCFSEKMPHCKGEMPHNGDEKPRNVLAIRGKTKIQLAIIL